VANRQQLISRRRKELLGKGYPPGIVELAMSWATGSAEGVANYALQQEFSDDNDRDVEQLTVKFLPRYLKDSENWIKSFGHQPTQ